MQASRRTVQSLSRTVLNLMNRIEDRTGSMFHVMYPELDKQIQAALDSNSWSQLQAVIQQLDELN